MLAALAVRLPRAAALLLSSGPFTLQYLLLALIPIAFGLNPVIGRALHDSFEPATLTGLRWSISALIIGSVALARGRRERWRASPTQYASLIALGMGGMGFCSYAAYAATSTATATTVGLIYACTAAVVAAYEIATGRARASGALVLGLLLCLVGVGVLLTRGHLEALVSLPIGAGEMWSVAGTLVWAAYSIAMRPRAQILTPFAGFTVLSIAATVAALPIMMWELHARPWAVLQPVFQPVQGIWIAALALITGVAAFMGYNWSLTRNGAILTSASISLAPIYIAVMAVVLIGEAIAWYHGVALALVSLGLIVVTLEPGRVKG
jgi:drug/metabolite transporter (DMT)-like permease